MAFRVLAEIAEGAPVTEPQSVGAAYYHQKANEIRGFARQSKFPEITEELFKLAGRFDRMADLVVSDSYQTRPVRDRPTSAIARRLEALAESSGSAPW